MVLFNLNNNMDVEFRMMVIMGDILVLKGFLDVVYFCYFMVQVGFGVYMKKIIKFVLIGLNYSLLFLKFVINEVIQRMEVYEYVQFLGVQICFLFSFQVFKFIYFCCLVEMGLVI